MGQEGGLQLLAAFAVEATDSLDNYEVGGGCIITPSRLLCTSRLIYSFVLSYLSVDALQRPLRHPTPTHHNSRILQHISHGCKGGPAP
jgi:hypothetical protein